jgi:hypothetical protein
MLNWTPNCRLGNYSDLIGREDGPPCDLTAFAFRPGYDNEQIGGIKVVARSGWFGARPSGTEDVYEMYADGFLREEYLKNVQADPQSSSVAFSTRYESCSADFNAAALKNRLVLSSKCLH